MISCFLSETWTSKDSEIELDGYCCFNFYRKFRHRRAKRNSGGIVLYCKNTIKNGVTIVKNHFDTIIWLKLDKAFFANDSDIYVCGVYIWGNNSPAAIVYDVDVFQILQDDINNFVNLGKVLIAGDFNARTANRKDYIECDGRTHDIDVPDYTADIPLGRVSEDHTCT